WPRIRLRDGRQNDEIRGFLARCAESRRASRRAAENHHSIARAFQLARAACASDRASFEASPNPIRLGFHLRSLCARPLARVFARDSSRRGGIRAAMALRRKVMVFLYRRNPGLEVLLLKRTKTGKGDWHPVTGNVEAHEAIPAAASREVLEETGLGVVPEPLGFTHTYELDGNRYHETAFASST